MNRPVEKQRIEYLWQVKRISGDPPLQGIGRAGGGEATETPGKRLLN